MGFRNDSGTCRSWLSGHADGNLHCIDMYLSCVGGGKCKEGHVWAQLFVIFLRCETKMSGRRARVQSDKSLNVVLLDPGSGTEPEIDFPNHDQDAGDDEACVAANTNRLTDVPAKDILNEKFEDDAARAICYLEKKQFQLEISFQRQHNYMAHVNPVEDRQRTNWHRKRVWKFWKKCAVPGMHRPVEFNGLKWVEVLVWMHRF